MSFDCRIAGGGFIIATILIGACTTNSAGPTTNGDASADASSQADSTTTPDTSTTPDAGSADTGAVDSGTASIDAGVDSGTMADAGTADAGTTSDGSTPDAANAPETGSGDSGAKDGAATDGAPGKCSIQGTWNATQYACSGQSPQSFPAGFTWQFTVTDTAGSFTEDRTGLCSDTSTGTALCGGNDIFITSTVGTQCTPADCLSANACGMLAAPLEWTYSQPTATTLVFTTVDPTPLTTCTSQGLQNPLTVYWSQE